MTAWRALRARWPAVAAVALVEAIASWVLAWHLAGVLLAPIAARPEGADAVVAEDGRIAIDLGAQHSAGFARGALVALAGVALYALFAALGDGVLPATFTSARPLPVRRALGVALRRAPASIALGASALAGYALAAALGYGALRGGAGLVDRAVDPRLALALWLALLAPAGAFAFVVHVAHDLARVHLLGAPAGVLRAAGHGVRTAALSPRRTVLGYVPYALGAAALLGCGAWLGAWRGRSTPGALVLMISLQQLVGAARVVLRAHWIARLGRTYRESMTDSV